MAAIKIPVSGFSQNLDRITVSSTHTFGSISPYIAMGSQLTVKLYMRVAMPVQSVIPLVRRKGSTSVWFSQSKSSIPC